MFKKLKEKLKNWTKKVSEETEEKTTKKDIKQKKSKKEGNAKIKIPLKNSIASQKYEPDIEKIKETKEKIKEKNFLKKATSKISTKKISDNDFKKHAEELELLLLENNVALEVVDKIISALKNQIIEKKIQKKEIEKKIKQIFKETIEDILIEPSNLKKEIKKKNSNLKEPYVILFCGINGTGKTTTIAKIANYLKKDNISCVIAAADTFRAASIEQIKKHGENLKVKIIASEYGADPASVGFDSIKYAKKNLIDCVLIDTAGRMHTAKNLLKEIEKINRICKPDLKIFVGESITGNDILEQIRSFDSAIGIDSIILTKADIDEKGGTALSVGYITKKPILYIGTGQGYKEIEPFNKKNFIKKLGL